MKRHIARIVWWTSGVMLCGCNPKPVQYHIKYETNNWRQGDIAVTNYITTNKWPGDIWLMDIRTNEPFSHLMEQPELFTVTNGRVIIWKGYDSNIIYTLFELSTEQFEQVWRAYPTNQERHNFAFGKP